MDKKILQDIEDIITRKFSYEIIDNNLLYLIEKEINSILYENEINGKIPKLDCMVYTTYDKVLKNYSSECELRNDYSDREISTLKSSVDIYFIDKK